MSSFNNIAPFLVLILVGVLLIMPAYSLESLAQSTGNTSTKVEIQGPTGGHAGDTLTFTSRALTCVYFNDSSSSCKDIQSGLRVVFYVEAPSTSDNQVQNVTLDNGQAQASFTFANPGRYVVSAIANDRASETVVQIAPSQAQTQGGDGTNSSSSGSPSEWLSAPVFAAIVFIIIIIVAVFVIRGRRH